jgi:hypothetical protein
MVFGSLYSVSGEAAKWVSSKESPFEEFFTLAQVYTVVLSWQKSPLRVWRGLGLGYKIGTRRSPAHRMIGDQRRLRHALYLLLAFLLPLPLFRFGPLFGPM